MIITTAFLPTDFFDRLFSSNNYPCGLSSSCYEEQVCWHSGEFRVRIQLIYNLAWQTQKIIHFLQSLFSTHTSHLIILTMQEKKITETTYHGMQKFLFIL